jgi:hypothetical protein
MRLHLDHPLLATITSPHILRKAPLLHTIVINVTETYPGSGTSRVLRQVNTVAISQTTVGKTLKDMEASLPRAMALHLPRGTVGTRPNLDISSHRRSTKVNFIGQLLFSMRANPQRRALWTWRAEQSSATDDVPAGS